MAIIEASGTARPVAGSVLQAKKLHEDATLPTRAHSDDAGLDLYACIHYQDEYTLEETGAGMLHIGPGEVCMVGTQIALSIPYGHVGKVCPRSGLAAKGVTVMNAPGILDSSFRGEVKVLLYNSNTTEFIVSHGDRIAQLLVQEVALPVVVEVEELPDHKGRGDAGFGSTGV